MDRHDDVRFRGKAIPDLTREEAIEALGQALDKLKFYENSQPLDIFVGPGGGGGADLAKLVNTSPYIEIPHDER